MTSRVLVLSKTLEKRIECSGTEKEKKSVWVSGPMHVQKSVWVSGPMHVKKSVWVSGPMHVEKSVQKWRRPVLCAEMHGMTIPTKREMHGTPSTSCMVRPADESKRKE